MALTTALATDDGKEYRLRLTGHIEDQTVSQELALRGRLNEAALRRKLHDALDRMIFSALAAERRG